MVVLDVQLLNYEANMCHGLKGPQHFRKEWQLSSHFLYKVLKKQNTCMTYSYTDKSVTEDQEIETTISLQRSLHPRDADRMNGPSWDVDMCMWQNNLRKKTLRHSYHQAFRNQHCPKNLVDRDACNHKKLTMWREGMEMKRLAKRPHLLGSTWKCICDAFHIGCKYFLLIILTQ